MTDSLRIIRCSGNDLHHYIADLAQLRISIFREFPYLYDGDMDYETKYLGTYVKCPTAVIVVALDGEKVVGASTGMPLQHENPDFQRPFVENGYDVARVFYCAESVLHPVYRGRGLGVRFFEEREAHARELGGFDWFAFCAVERSADHPRRPVDYVPLDRFWQKRGYTRHPELSTQFSWKDLDENDQSPKKLTYWLKRTSPANAAPI